MKKQESYYNLKKMEYFYYQTLSKNTLLLGVVFL